MNPQTLSSIRILMMVGGTWLTNHGYGNAKDLATLSDPAVLEAIIGLGSTVGGVVWALSSRTTHGILKTASKVLGDKGVIVTDAATAARLPANVVDSIPAAAKVVSAAE